MRKKYGLNIIAIVRGEETIVEILPDFILRTDDLLAVIGKKDNVLQFEKHEVS